MVITKDTYKGVKIACLDTIDTHSYTTAFTYFVSSRIHISDHEDLLYACTFGYHCTGCTTVLVAPLYWVHHCTGCTTVLGVPLYWVNHCTGCTTVLSVRLSYSVVEY